MYLWSVLHLRSVSRLQLDSVHLQSLHLQSLSCQTVPVLRRLRVQGLR